MSSGEGGSKRAAETEAGAPGKKQAVDGVIFKRRPTSAGVKVPLADIQDLDIDTLKWKALSLYPGPTFVTELKRVDLVDVSSKTTITKISEINEGSEILIQNVSKNTATFWDNCTAAPLGTDGFYTFTTPMMGCPDLYDNVLYVRDCYKDLEKSITAHFAARTAPICITGTPGIGKSHFLIYMAIRLLATIKDVTLVVEFTGYRYLITEHSVMGAPTPAFSDIILDSDVYYLVDSSAPAHRTAKTILFTSPDRNIYREAMKSTKAVTFYMPTFSLEELQDLRKKQHPAMTAKDVRKRFDVLGGIPRSIFSELSIDAELRKVSGACPRTNLDNLRACLGQTEKTRSVSDIIVHIFPSDDYLDCMYDFGSRHIMDECIREVYQNSKKKLISILKGHDLPSSYSVFRGHAFESLVHTHISKGYNAKIRDLSIAGSTGQKFVFPAFPTNTFQDVVDAKAGMYNRPGNANFGAIDAVIMEIGFLQITLNALHGINGTALAQWSTTAVPPVLIFLVPTNMAASYPQQTFQKKPLAGTPAAAWLATVKQYVIGIDMKIF